MTYYERAEKIFEELKDRVDIFADKVVFHYNPGNEICFYGDGPDYFHLEHQGYEVTFIKGYVHKIEFPTDVKDIDVATFNLTEFLDNIEKCLESEKPVNPFLHYRDEEILNVMQQIIEVVTKKEWRCLR